MSLWSRVTNYNCSLRSNSSKYSRPTEHSTPTGSVPQLAILFRLAHKLAQSGFGSSELFRFDTFNELWPPGYIFLVFAQSEHYNCFMNILVKVGLTRLLFASGIADKQWFRLLLGFGILLVVIYVMILMVVHEMRPDPHEVLIKENQIFILSSDKSKFPLFGEDDQWYYFIYPALHYKTRKNSSCAEFVPHVRETWCGNEKFLPTCNPGVTDCFVRY